MKTIKIACKGAEALNIDDLKELQGELKDLSPEAEAMLWKSIEDDGFAFPFHAWKDPRSRKTYLVSGHQRKRVLVKKRDDEGYVIPKLPVTYVEARDIRHARRRVLQDVAQYGVVTPQGMYDFMVEAKIDYAGLARDFKIPEFDMPSFERGFFPNGDTVDVNFKAKTGSQELDEEGFSKFDHACPKCGFEFDEK